MDRDLIDYLIRFGAQHFTASEYMGLNDISHVSDPNDPAFAKQELLASRYPEGGLTREANESQDAFEQRVAERLQNDHGNELVKRCPQCNGLLRTPEARHCKQCHFVWH